MSEPMPGALPARQYGQPAEAAGSAERDGGGPPEPAAAGTAATWAATGAASAPGQPVSAPQTASSHDQDQDQDRVEDRVQDPEPAPEPEAQAPYPEPDGAGDPSRHQDGAERNDQEPADDDAPRPLGLHVEPTGNAAVDAGLRRLEDADQLAVSGHLEVYEDVHRGLREALAGLDRQAPASGHASGPAPGPGSGQTPGPAGTPGSAAASPHAPARPVPGPSYSRS